ncbi:hypothetical protein BC830DRAFT_1133788 [Chytriomyces sp. MP71]|nr:hypothetical protein BC830DRAFT_1133788 [Chytriomyces sp. MP71]
MGFCSDFVQYIFHAKGRLVDEFGPSEFHAKRISCPTSTYLQGEYLRHEFLDDITISAIDTQRVAELNSVSASSLPRSLPRVRNLWLPNIEQLRHDHIPALSLMHKVLCKTRVTCTALRQYSQRNLALANTPQFQFMSHSSPDVLHDAQHVLGLARFMHLMRTTRSYNKFLHAFGKTGSKRTDQVVECWLEHPEWPALVLIGAPYAYRKNLQQAARGRKNIVQQGFVNIRALRALQIEYGVHICSSSQEGYGHYINDARSMGSLLMTTNHPPMNEFVHADGVDGILIDHDGHPFSADYQALHNEFKSAVDVRTTDICAAVERVLKLSEEERERLGAEGRRSYDQDTILMVKRMGELLEEAWKHLGADEASLKDAGRSY